MSPDFIENDNVFANRNFRLVFLGALVSELGAVLYNFAVSFYILEITGNNAFLQGLYLSLCGVAMLVFTSIGGVLGDRFNKARIMYVCDYLKGGMIILATLLMLLFRGSEAHIIILFALGILSNAVSGVFIPASGALFPHIIKESQLQQANAYFTIKNSLEGILGIVLAGILYTALPIHTLFCFVGACFVASGVSEMLIRYDHKPSPEHLTFILAVRDMRDGLVYLKTKKAILALLSAIVFINFFFAPITGNFLPYFVKSDLAEANSYFLDHLLTPELWSSVFSVFFGISSLTGAAILSIRPQEEKIGRNTALKLCMSATLLIGMTICYWQFVNRHNSINGFLAAFSVCCLIMGCLISFINIPVNTTLMRIVDKDKLSKINSIMSIGSQAMIPIASVLAGIILNTAGSTTLLAACSLGFTITVAAMLLNKQIKEL